MKERATPRLNLVLCWHMHQPWYRESQEGEFCLPWVYLHALKDYVDMAAHLEAHPKMRCVVNFTPVLLEQLDDYAAQFKRHLDTGTRFSDPLLNLLAGIDPIPAEAERRADIVRACRRANASTMIDVYPAFRSLFGMVMSLDGKTVDAKRLAYMNEQYFLDLLSWYHLTWLGHSLKRLPHVKSLLEHDGVFDEYTRHALLEVMCDAFDGLLGRYAELAQRGQIELSMTPYGHPIVPLLIDLGSMNCALPEAKGRSAPTTPMASKGRVGTSPAGSKRSRNSLAAGRVVCGFRKGGSASMHSNCWTSSVSPGAPRAKAFGATAVFFQGLNHTAKRRAAACSAHMTSTNVRHGCSFATTASRT